MIRLWNDRKLARELALDSVSEGKMFAYFLIYQFGLILVCAIPCEPEGFEFSDWISLVLSLIITTIGFSLCFSSNKDKKAFVARCICLGIPIFFKAMMIFMLPLSFLMFGSFFYLSEEAADRIWDNDFLMFFFVHAMEVFFFWRLRSDIRLIQAERFGLQETGSGFVSKV
jgi:hypothetical protein